MIKKKIEIGTKINPYCSNRKCKDLACLKHWNNAPMNKMVWREKFSLNKNGICNDRL